MTAPDFFMLLAFILFFGVLLSLFLRAKKTSSEGDLYNALDKNRNENQEELIRTAFALADRHGGLWQISFSSHGITIYKREGGSQYFPLSNLGYSELDLHKYIVAANRHYREFPSRLKRAAECRGYLYWSEKGHAVVQGSSYTSYDGGHSYTREDSAGDYIKSVNVCSVDYYKIYKPFPDPDQPPLKKL